MAALSWYVAGTASALTGAGSGSVTPWSPEMSLSSTSWSGSSASRIRSGSHRPSMIGLTKSCASRSQSSLSQFFQAPFFQSSTSIPCSLSLSLMWSGIRMPPLPSSATADAEAEASPPASGSPSSHAVAVRASAETSATAAAVEEAPRRPCLRPRVVNDGRMDRMVLTPPAVNERGAAARPPSDGDRERHHTLCGGCGGVPTERQRFGHSRLTWHAAPARPRGRAAPPRRTAKSPTRQRSSGRP